MRLGALRAGGGGGCGSRFEIMMCFLAFGCRGGCLKRQEPDTPVRARLALEAQADWVFDVGSDLQPLDGPESRTDGVHFPGAGLLLTVDAFELEGQIAQQVESFVQLVPEEQGHVDGFFRGRFLSFGGRWWCVGGGCVDHGDRG